MATVFDSLSSTVLCGALTEQEPLQELSGIEKILGEKTELPGFRDEFRRFRPEAVIDCIGYTSSAGAKIAETFKGWLERLVFLSSCDVYERINKRRY